MTNTKYELTDECIQVGDEKLYRIRALRDISTRFGLVKAGSKGGFIASEANLDTTNDAWVGYNAQVKGKAYVSGNAQIGGNAYVGGNAHVVDNAYVNINAFVVGDTYVVGNAYVGGNARVEGSARVDEDARVGGNAHVGGNAQVREGALITSSRDYMCLHPIGSRLDTLTAYRGEKGDIRVVVGCFEGGINKFKDRVCEAHEGDVYEWQYLKAIELIHFSLSQKY